VCRSYYTDAFGEELQRLREGEDGEGVRVDFLVQCIEAGVPLFSGVEQQLVVHALKPPPPHRSRPVHATSSRL
jgi:hypothetical protein